jgi:hypothetical protein
MAELHVVSASMAKRSEVAGVIADLERKAAQQRADLVHVDAVLGCTRPSWSRIASVPGSAPAQRLVQAGRTDSDGAGHCAGCAGSHIEPGDCRRCDG